MIKNKIYYTIEELIEGLRGRKDEDIYITPKLENLLDHSATGEYIYNDAKIRGVKLIIRR
jgi:hypothetical protein